MGWLYDTHVHLADPAYADDMEVIMHNMGRMRTRACCVSTGVGDSARTLELAGAGGLVLPFVGIHPEMAGDDLDAMARIIEGNANKIAGIGEVGLDPTLCGSAGDHARQRAVFDVMLAAAERHAKPVSIHSRKCLDEVLSIMGSYSISGACLHWFDGNRGQLRRATDMGLFVAFGPVMVYARDKQDLLARADAGSILVETDGPVRFGRCFGDRQAQISFIPSVVFAAAKARGVSYDGMCDILEENSRRFLGVGGDGPAGA